MEKFEIGKEFYLSGKPFKILSGAIHYFRMLPSEWYHSLYNLKALGFNTVETYIPWNIHEPNPGEYDFSEYKDVERFLNIAQALGLYAIVRPTPYICAEWEFGGLPAWLLTKKCQPRTADPEFITYVTKYYQALFPRLLPHQIDQGGNILMMQVENEYGSFGEDQEYLRKLKNLMQNLGVTVPLFTSDGPGLATLRAGSLITDDIFVTGNFGSHAAKNFASIQKFLNKHNKKWPLMCMEFWDGWFNRWNEPIVRRDTSELVSEIRETIKLGSINIYMFHGGTNFGFMNGCSARREKLLPQITSYDYGALLDESGNPTQRYFAIQKMLRTELPDLVQSPPLFKEKISVSHIALTGKVSLFSVYSELSHRYESNCTQTMEDLGQNFGYILYQTSLPKDNVKERIRIIDGGDRVQVYLQGKHVATQYQEEIGEDIFIERLAESEVLSILVENMGRVNYGPKLFSEKQKKGIRTGVMSDLHFIKNWHQYCLDLSVIEKVDFSKAWDANQPAFYRYEFELDEPKDTFIDLSNFGKGCVFVNGFNIGRFWEVGPTQSLYLPKDLLTYQNTIIIFETEGKYCTHLNLVKHPIITK